jgi:hypothetical protein
MGISLSFRRTPAIEHLLNFRLSFPIEASAENSLYDQVVGSGGGTCTDANVDLAFRQDIEVDYREDLLLLVMQRIKSSNAPVISVVF